MYRRYYFKTSDSIGRDTPANNLLSSMFYDSAYSGEYPGININSTLEETRIEVTIPGIPKDDILIELEGEILTVSVDTAEMPASGRIIGSERFSRSVELPLDSDLENISANHNNGILIVLVPKLSVAPIPHRTIKIS